MGQAVRFAPLPSALLRKALSGTSPTIPLAFGGLKDFRLSQGSFTDLPCFGRFSHELDSSTDVSAHRI